MLGVLPALAMTQLAAQRPILTETQVRVDLEEYVNVIKGIHPEPFWKLTESTFDRKVQEFNLGASRIQTVSELYQRLSRLTALLDDPHTFLYAEDWVRYREQDGPAFPMDVQWTDGKLYVKEDYSERPLKPGTEIESINGVQASNLFRSFLPLYSNLEPASQIDFGNSFFRRNLRWVRGWSTNFQVRPKGSREAISRPGLPAKAIVSKVPTGVFYVYHPIDKTTAVIEFRSCTDLEQAKQFVIQSLKRLKTDRVQNLIVDVRNNAGGDMAPAMEILSLFANKPHSMFGGSLVRVNYRLKIRFGKKEYTMRFGDQAWNRENDARVRYLVSKEDLAPIRNDRFRGNVAVLTGAGTFSNGMAFASAVRGYKLGTLVGQPTGGVASGFGQLEDFELPNSKIRVRVSTKQIWSPLGERERGPILPDVIAPETPLAKPYSSGDLAFQTAIRALKNSR